MPKVVDHEAYRCTLLRASFEVVAEVGYGSLSMKQLARSLAISPGLIYHYFENKEDWFVSLVIHFTEEVFEKLEAAIQRDACPSEKAAQLAAHIESNKELYANLIRVASDYVRMPSAGEGGARLQMTIGVEQLYAHIASLFDTDETTARALVSYLVGAIMANRLDPRSLDAAECLPVIRTLLGIREPSH